MTFSCCFISVMETVLKLEEEEDGEETMDLTGMSQILAELEIVLVKFEHWIVLQRSKFDFNVCYEPYHAVQGGNSPKLLNVAA
jgi:hypothetical protein